MPQRVPDSPLFRSLRARRVLLVGRRGRVGLVPPLDPSFLWFQHPRVGRWPRSVVKGGDVGNRNTHFLLNVRTNKRRFGPLNRGTLSVLVKFFRNIVSDPISKSSAPRFRLLAKLFTFTRVGVTVKRSKTWFTQLKNLSLPVVAAFLKFFSVGGRDCF